MKLTKGILVIDSDQFMLNTCQEYLSEHFTKIFLANNALAGLEILKKERIDIVLVDLRLPKLSGFEFIEIAKKRHPLIKYIFISAEVSILNLHRSIRCGITDFIEKPFSQTTFLERVMHACKDELHISNHSLRTVISEINRENSIQQKRLLLELRDEILTKLNLSHGNMALLRFDLEEIFELKLHSEHCYLINGLTPVESKVSELLNAGYTAMAISKKLNRSINTVQVHIRSIRKKLGLVKKSANHDIAL